jgi:hypothetical protein
MSLLRRNEIHDFHPYLYTDDLTGGEPHYYYLSIYKFSELKQELEWTGAKFIGQNICHKNGQEFCI